MPAALQPGGSAQQSRSARTTKPESAAAPQPRRKASAAAYRSSVPYGTLKASFEFDPKKTTCCDIPASRRGSSSFQSSQLIHPRAADGQGLLGHFLCDALSFLTCPTVFESAGLGWGFPGARSKFDPKEYLEPRPQSCYTYLCPYYKRSPEGEA